MAIYRYIVTVETADSGGFTTQQHADLIQQEIDSNLDYEIDSLNISHFTIEQAPIGYWPGQGFVESSLREGQADID